MQDYDQDQSVKHCKKWSTSYDEEFADDHRLSGLNAVVFGSLVCMAAFSLMLLVANH